MNFLNADQVRRNSTLQRVRKCILPLSPLGQAQVRARARAQAGKDQLKLGAKMALKQDIHKYIPLLSPLLA